VLTLKQIITLNMIKGRMIKVIQKVQKLGGAIQRFGGAMFTPVLFFAFAGVSVGFGTLFTTPAIMGGLAAETSLWYQFWNIILQGGWTVFNQLPLLFVVGLPIGLAKKQNARCCMEALILYLTFNYFLSTILSQWGSFFGVDFSAKAVAGSGLTMVANIKTLDMGMMGALVISGIVIYLHNRFFDTELPEWLGIFSGSTFVFMIGFFVMIPVAFIVALIWPKVQIGIFSFQHFVKAAGALGVWVFVFLERALIPFGLHHLLYAPFYYDNVVVPGGIYAYWAKSLPHIAASTASLKTLLPAASFTATGYSKIFGCPGIALAFYATAKSKNKKKLLGLLIPITLTAIICGVTEPIEYTFLFISPFLFLVHAVLAATVSTIMNLVGIVGVFSGGAIEMAALNWIPLMATHWGQYLLQFIIGICFTGVWFVVFRFLILKFDIKTPGRQDDSEEIKFNSKAEYLEKKSNSKLDKKTKFAMDILEGLGGKDNIQDVTNCATRLRVNVKDESICKGDQYFKSIGAHGCSINGKSYQVIVGLKVPSIREEFEKLL
jgi:alpha-glucoside PTS system EIICB component